MGIITVKQTPFNEYNEILPLRGNLDRLYSTWIYQPTIQLFDDFKYKIKLDTENESVTQQSISELNENYSKISFSNYLKNITRNIADIDAIELKKNEHGIRNYTLTITPYSNQTELTSDARQLYTCYGINGKGKYGKEFFPNDENDRMLLYPYKRKFNIDTYATNKILYGQFGHYTTEFNTDWDRIKYVVTKSNGSIYYYELNNTYTKYIPTDNYYLADTSTMLLTVPVGPANLNNTILYLSQIVLPSGVVFYPNIPTYANIEAGDSYKYAAFSGNTNQMSKWYENEVTTVGCESRFQPYSVSWLTEKGGYDTFVFYLNNNKTNKIKNKTYLKDQYNYKDTYHFGDFDTKERGKKVYSQDNKELVTVISNWLSKDDLTRLEELYNSPDIYIQIDNEILPVVNVTSKFIQPNKLDRSLIKVELILELARPKILV